MTDIEDDPIVQEIDVYLNRVSDASFLLLQYPLRPKDRPYGDQGQLTAVGYRPKQKTFQFSYSLNAGGENYDPTQIRQPTTQHPTSSQPNNLYSSFPTTSSTQSSVENEKLIHKLKSQRSIAENCSYAVGVFKDKSLYITPLTSVHQFRPDFEQVDLQYKKSQQRAEMKLKEAAERQDTTRTQDGGKDGKSDKKDESLNYTPKTVENNELVNIEGGGTGEGRHRISHSKLKEIEDEESWTPVEYFYDAFSPEAAELTNLLTTMKTAKKPSEHNKSFIDIEEEEEYIPNLYFVDDFDGYINSLCSIDDSNSNANSFKNSLGPLSYHVLSHMSIEDQVKAILKHRHIETFSNIKLLLTKETDNNELIKLLEEIATNILGNWVIKSEEVFEAYECVCRDFILISLTTNEGTGISRETYHKSGLLPIEKMNEILNQVAKYTSTGWQLKLVRDQNFIDNYPQIIKKYEQFWAEKKSFIYQEIVKQREKQSISISKLDSKSKEITKLIESYLLNKGVQSLDEIHTHLTQTNQTITKEELSSLLPSITESIGPLWAIKKIGNQQLDPFRDVIIKIFKENLDFPLSKTQIMEKMSEIILTPIQLPDFTMRKLLREFASNRYGKWLFKGHHLVQTKSEK